MDALWSRFVTFDDVFFSSASAARDIRYTTIYSVHCCLVHYKITASDKNSTRLQRLYKGDKDVTGAVKGGKRIDDRYIKEIQY